MNLWKFSGKETIVVLRDGQTIKGFAYDYTSALDNDPDPESITIDGVEIFVDEIKTIELAELSET